MDLTRVLGLVCPLPVFHSLSLAVVCPTELVAFSDRSPEFREINTNVIAISTDSHHTHLAWIRTPRNEGGLGGMDIPMVADISKEISRAYGVLVEDPLDDMYGAALRFVFCCCYVVAVHTAPAPTSQSARVCVPGIVTCPPCFHQWLVRD